MKGTTDSNKHIIPKYVTMTKNSSQGIIKQEL